jgi:DNA invertase Pin-like site-specific DNA recombinase
MKRVALYFRVSTDGQTDEPQRIELREYCARRGWEDIREFSDKMSGTKFGARAGLMALGEAVRRHQIDVVVCVKLDRLGRSLTHMAQMIGEFDTHRVALIATSQGIDTSEDNPAGRMQMHVLMAVAEFERALIKERTKAGLVAAKARGSVLGRPRFVITAEGERIIAEHGGGVAELAGKLGCSVGKAHGIMKARRGA